MRCGGSFLVWCFFFFQAEDGIRDAQESRGLGDVYKRQELDRVWQLKAFSTGLRRVDARHFGESLFHRHVPVLSLIHI